MAESVLLSLWIPFLGVLYFGCELWTNFHCDDILPVVRRGKNRLDKLYVNFVKQENQLKIIAISIFRTIAGGGEVLSSLEDQPYTFFCIAYSISSPNYP